MRSLSSKYEKSNFSTFKTMNLMSLPSLKNPVRQKVDSLLNSEREKIHQKLRLNYYPNDISHLKDKGSVDIGAKLPMNFLSTDIVEVYNKVYKSNETDLDFLNVVKKKQDNGPQLSFIEKLLSPRKKSLPQPCKTFLIGAPTSRQEAINLKAWVDFMDEKYFNKFREILIGKGNLNRDKVLKAWKSVYLTVFTEIEKQISVHCAERGKLLMETIQGYEQLYDFSYSKYLIELQRLSDAYAREISEARLESAKKLAHFQVKIDHLEKEKFEIRHNNGQCIIKIRELERIIEDYRRNEKTNLRGGAKFSTQKYQNASFEESPTIKEDKQRVLSVPETLVEDINKKIKKFADIKKKIQESSEELKMLETEICDKNVALASVNFEMELRQTLIRPIAKYTPKSIINLSPNKEKKKLQLETSTLIEADSASYQSFFKNLLEKPKERLTHKCKVSQDHIFQSLSVIYQRAIIQIEIFNEILDFQQLVYKQFVKLENRKKSEKILKNFVSGCLKLCDFRRVSVFLRFLGIGNLIDKKNFSTKTLQLYLSSYLYMDTQSIGLLIHKDTSSPTQFYPLSRALASLKELSVLFPPKQRMAIESFLRASVIQDPKQINPQGLIELEIYLEKLSEEYEQLTEDITQNCSLIFETVSKRLSLSTEYFRLVLHKISPDRMAEVEDTIEKEYFDGVFEIKAKDAAEIACKFQLLMTDDIIDYLGNLANVSESFGKNLIRSQYPSPVPSIYENMLDSLDEIELRFGLVWWKILNNNQ